MHRPGEVIEERFELVREVARGGTSTVWLARDAVEQNDVAMKFVACLDHDAVVRFTREVAVLTRVRHPGIVRCIAHGSIDATERYVAMQWIAGIDLAERLRRPTRSAEIEVHKHAERGILAGATGEDRTVLRWLEAVAAYWQSRYADASRFASEAALAAPKGSREWFLAIAEQVVSSARLSDFQTVEARFLEAAGTTADAGAEAAQLVCLCRSTFQMIFNGRFAMSDAMLARIDALATDVDRLDPLTAAQIHHVRGVRAAHAGSVSTFLGHLELAVDAFERGKDRNNVLLERTTVGRCWAEVGDFVEAEQKLRRSLAACVSAGAQQAITYAKVNLGFALVHRAGALDEAIAVLDEAIRECRAVGNARLEGWAAAHASTAFAIADRWDESAEYAAAAVKLLATAPSLLGWAEACKSRAALARGRIDDAIESARRANTILTELGGMLQGEALPPLVLARALAAAGRHDDARVAADDGRRRLERRLGWLPREDWKALSRAIPDNAAMIALVASFDEASPRMDETSPSGA